MGVFFERGISQIHTCATRSSCANGQRAGKRAAHAFGTLSQSPRVPRPAQFFCFSSPDSALHVVAALRRRRMPWPGRPS